MYSVDPQYTDEARKKKINGVCVLSLTVDKAGMPQNIKVTRSVDELQPVELHKAAAGLDANAIDAAAEYRFRPGTFKGQPVPIDIHIEINYQLY